MSIRIHALAKELNVPSKDLIDFINSRKEVYGLEIKTSSNAIAPLYADTIKSDFLKEQQAPETRKPRPPPHNQPLHSPSQPALPAPGAKPARRKSRSLPGFPSLQAPPPNPRRMPKLRKAMWSLRRFRNRKPNARARKRPRPRPPLQFLRLPRSARPRRKFRRQFRRCPR